MTSNSTKVTLLDLACQHQPLETEIMDAITRVVRSGKFIMGPEVQTFEEAIARYCGVPYAIGVSSGTDALLAALMALNLKPGEGVITSTFSFFATAGVIARLGARPIFVDIDPQTFNLAPEAIRHTWDTLRPEERSQVRAIMPVHLFGQCAEMAPMLDFAVQHGLAVIEDAAQSLGAEYPWAGESGGRNAGVMGQMGCFSFFPSKNLGGFGDGGMVTTSDAALAERLRVLRVHGAKPRYYHHAIGGNFRLDTLQAAVLLVKLPHLDRWHQERRENAARYNALFAATSLEEFITLPVSIYEDRRLRFPHIYNQYVIRAQQRDALIEYLTIRGIGTAVYYPVPLHQQACFTYLGYQKGSLPESERAAQEVVALPIYPGLTPAQQKYVVDSIEQFYRGA
ncbi:MAG: DegT/DnrJ/EryC1/StrS family aminotransferase [Chloroflexi bacterium]|nr:DegT/DnrJ/EryC1/StrS family aminotransferase [Chloroflexota bacterium]MBU1751178.1 DegT/DnrJ/EryC1/StrS family aminotransferase [Chloroflexota bacterium]